MVDIFRERFIIRDSNCLGLDVVSSPLSTSNSERRVGTTTSFVEDCNDAINCSSSFVVVPVSFSNTTTLRNDKMDPAACNLVMVEKLRFFIVFVRSVTAEVTEGVVEATATVPRGRERMSVALSSNREWSARAALVTASAIGSPSFPISPIPFFVAVGNCKESAAIGSTDNNCGKALAPNRRTALGQFSISPARVSRDKDRRDHCSFRHNHCLSMALLLFLVVVAALPFLLPPFSLVASFSLATSTPVVII
mmetsp:Transcript_6423/g.13998  ORF Transcript_6423/g.13998 Transcript_6423/m.13998 type:complete len:251 (+) Transcript_6423:1561-2313(+)